MSEHPESSRPSKGRKDSELQNFLPIQECQARRCIFFLIHDSTMLWWGLGSISLFVSWSPSANARGFTGINQHKCGENIQPQKAVLHLKSRANSKTTAPLCRRTESSMLKWNPPIRPGQKFDVRHKPPLGWHSCPHPARSILFVKLAPSPIPLNAVLVMALHLNQRHARIFCFLARSRLWQFRSSSDGSINGLSETPYHSCQKHGCLSWLLIPTSCKRRPKSPAYLRGWIGKDAFQLHLVWQFQAPTSLPPSSSFPRLLGTTRPWLHRKHQEKMESMESKSDSTDSKRAHLESSVSMSKAPWNMFSVSDASIQWMNICNSLQWRVIISCTWTWLFGSQVCCQERLQSCSKILIISSYCKSVHIN